jgi:hypothetical protein
VEKLDFAERDKYKPVLLRFSLARNLEKPLMSLYGTERRERGYGLRELLQHDGSNTFLPSLSNFLKKGKIFNKMKNVNNSWCHELKKPTSGLF